MISSNDATAYDSKSAIAVILSDVYFYKIVETLTI